MDTFPDKTLPQKDEARAYPVPCQWRGTFCEIVRAFVSGDYQLSVGVSDVRPVSEDTAKHIEAYIADYGEILVELPTATWESSVVQWMGSYWEVVVDLWTEAEGRSDQILSTRVFETERGIRFEIQMVYVP